MTKEELTENLKKDGYLKTPAVIEAFQKIDRGDFIPAESKNQAYENIALPIGFKQTISQPLVVTFMLELLEIKAGEKILEIGTGSGWKTALLANLTGESGKIVSLERIAELAEFSKENLKKYPALGNTMKLVLGDGSKGYFEEAPYDKIIAAAAGKEIPVVWKEQLRIGGRIVAPAGDSIKVIDKIAKDKFEEKDYFGFSFVPLIENLPP